MKGININDSQTPWTELILSGRKTIETRKTNSLRPYINQRVGIIRTGKGQAHLVGYMTVGEPKIYNTVEEFRADEPLHQVAAGNEYDWDGPKYGYPIYNVQRTEPKPITSRGIVAREISERHILNFNEFVMIK